jgi:hypothetical protein
MRLQIHPLTENIVTLMRRAGYTFDRQAGTEQSYVRVLGSSGYPRFHMYVRTEKMTAFINIHLDQKKHTYGEDTRHHGEYEESAPLTEEVSRLLTSFGEHASIV